ncbi:MAG: 30S ribosomal protein S2, partial [bacterium]
MVKISVKELLEAGLHFGHQTKRWNPKMSKYIFNERNGIHLINLLDSAKYFRKACSFIEDETAHGKTVLFVGTKQQSHEPIIQEALRCGMPYVCNRWLGGMLTNYETIKKSVNRLKKLEAMSTDGTYEMLPKKETIKLEKERIKLDRNLGGIKDMKGLPSIVFVIDPNKEKNAVSEARKKGITVVGLVDTNCDPDVIDYVIPGNDDAIRSIKLVILKISEAIMAGRETYETALKKEQAEQAAAEQEEPAADRESEKEEADAKTEVKAELEPAVLEDKKDVAEEAEEKV